MIDKNGIKIEHNVICAIIDKKGNTWIAPVFLLTWTMAKGEEKFLTFCSNWRVAIHDYCSEKFEIVGKIENGKQIIFKNLKGDNIFMY